MMPELPTAHMIHARRRSALPRPPQIDESQKAKKEHSEQRTNRRKTDNEDEALTITQINPTVLHLLLLSSLRV